MLVIGYTMTKDGYICKAKHSGWTVFGYGYSVIEALLDAIDNCVSLEGGFNQLGGFAPLFLFFKYIVQV